MDCAPSCTWPRRGHTCSSKDIAQDMSIPRDYLIQLAQLFCNAGIIEARPGTAAIV